jgi:hypothetical protein
MVRVWLTDKTEGTLPVPIVSDLQVDLAFIDGWFGPVKLESPMMTSRLDVGIPAVQFPAVFQSTLIVPFQEVCAAAGDADIKSRPKTANKNGASKRGRSVESRAANLPVPVRRPTDRIRSMHAYKESALMTQGL